MEERIFDGVEHNENGVSIRLAPQETEEICRAIEAEVARLTDAGYPPIVLVAPRVRPAVRQLTAARLPQLVVLSYDEITRDTRIESAGMASCGEWVKDGEFGLAAAGTAA